MAFSQAWTWEPTEDGRTCHGGKFCSHKHTNEEVQHWETGRSYQDGSHTGLEDGYRGKQNKEFSIDAGADATTDATKSYAALTANKIVAKHKAYNKMRDKMMVGKVLPWVHISIKAMQRGVFLTRTMTSRETFCSSTSTSSAISSTEDISDFTCSTGLSFAHAPIERVSSIGFTDLDDCGYSFCLLTSHYTKSPAGRATVELERSSSDAGSLYTVRRIILITNGNWNAA